MRLLTRKLIAATAAVLFASLGAGLPARAQASGTAALTGAWVPMGGGRGVDPKFAPPPAGPIVLKPEYA